MATAAAWTAALAIIQGAASVPVQEANGTGQTPAGDLFIRVGARAGDGSATEMGRLPLHSEEGAIECLIFAGLGTGSLAARQEVDRIIAAFRLAEPGFIQWTGWSVDESPDQGQEAWWVLVLTIRYRTFTAVS